MDKLQLPDGEEFVGIATNSFGLAFIASTKRVYSAQLIWNDELGHDEYKLVPVAFAS